MAEQVADFVLGRLRGWGVHRVFAYPGDGINGILGALGRAEGDSEFIQPRCGRASTSFLPRSRSVLTASTSARTADESA